MAVPKRRKSKSKTRMRKAHYKVSVPNLRACPKCGAYTELHRVCPECGYYKGGLVVEKKIKMKE